MEYPVTRKRTTFTIAGIAVLLAAFAFAFSPFTDGATGESQLASTAGVTTTTADGPTQAEIDTLNEAILQRELDRQALNVALWVNHTNLNTWVTKTNERIAAEEAAAEAAAAKREAESQRSSPTTSSPPAANPSGPATGRCGGDLPPCWVMMRESGGSLTAQNPTSTASGKWQFLDSTWGGYGGYASAWMAPESVQDARARELWAGGAGCSHWSACG